MTLQEFFAALQNPNMVVTIKEPTDGEATVELTKIFASGYEQLLASLLARTVDELTILNNNNAEILLTAGV